MSVVLKSEASKEEAMPAGAERAQKNGSSARYHWTRNKYESLIEKGVLLAGERVELIGGEIVTMSPQRSAHATSISLVEEAIRRRIPSGCYIRVQMPFSTGDDSQPEPDLLVVRGKARDFAKNHPNTALLAIEISDTTLALDRTIKAGLYASAGVPEYWIVNLQDSLLEVHRQPAAMADQPFDHHYKSIERLSADQTIQPLDTAGEPIAVRDLLP